jgi:GST-like protein
MKFQGYAMINLYTWPTPNGHKVHIMLEETGADYTVHPINIGEGDQFEAEFLKISPNNKMPAMVDQDGPGGEPIAIFESAAILVYLGNKTGQFLPSVTDEPVAYYDTMQWLMFQMGGIGPLLGQAHHFNDYARQRIPLEQIQYGIDRYVNEANRLYGVVDRQLDGRDWIAAGRYTIADMAIFPWLRYPERQGVDIADYPNVERWRDGIWKRPAVVTALKVLEDQRRQGVHTDKQWEIMYGKTQRTQGQATG